jgi:ParB family chromosome partitioning protein
LVQIATSYANGGNPAVLGRNRYVALQLGARNGKSKSPLSPHQKPCKQMTEAIVMDGSQCGHIVKVCADPACPVHFADRRSPSPEQMAKEREQRRRELEKQKLAVTIRHRTLAEILKKVGSPLEKAGLALVAATLVAKLEPLRCEALARRHKLVEGKPSEVTYPQVQKATAGLLRRADESALSKLLVELVLLDTLDHVPSAASSREDDVLAVTAKRYGVDVEKLSKAVEKECAAKQAKQKERQDKKSRAKKNPAGKEPTTAA